MYIVVINPNNGKVEASKVFDTHEESEQFDEFITTDSYPDGFIIAVACKDDCITKLSDNAK